MKKKRALTYFENKMKFLFEGSFRRLIGEDFVLQPLINRLLEAIESSESEGYYNNNYHIEVSLEDFGEANTRILEEELENLVSAFAEEMGKKLDNQVHIVVTIRDDFSRGQIAIESTRDAEIGMTVGFPAASNQLAKEEIIDRDAFLIINGHRHYEIRDPIVTVGRQLDNDIVIDLKSVSRRHAQIRWRMDQFIVYDLDSKSGTFVNGTKIAECVLRPGDVIGISETNLIFGEGQSEFTEMKPHVSDHFDTKPLPNLDNL